MRLLFILLTSIGLAACKVAVPAPSAPDPVPPAHASPAPSPVTAVSLEGEWRVAAVDGAELNEPYGIALTGSARELWWAPRCAFIVRSYRMTGSTIAFGPALGAPKPGEMPPPVCTVAPPPRMKEILRALDMATTVVRTEQNGVLISGHGRSVLLFSQ